MQRFGASNKKERRGQHPLEDGEDSYQVNEDLTRMGLALTEMIVPLISHLRQDDRHELSERLAAPLLALLGARVLRRRMMMRAKVGMCCSNMVSAISLVVDEEY